MTFAEFKGVIVNGTSKDVAHKLGLTRRTIRKVRQHFQNNTQWRGAFARASEKCGVTNA